MVEPSDSTIREGMEHKTTGVSRSQYGKDWLESRRTAMNKSALHGQQKDEKSGKMVFLLDQSNSHLKSQLKKFIIQSLSRDAYGRKGSNV